MVQFWVQFILVLGAILIGIRRGSVALGMLGGLGVAILTIGFHNPPASGHRVRHAACRRWP
jgi:anaerobic C4-dicarboxylate transporter DcuB